MTVRVLPNGSSLPWAAELACERERRVVYVDAVGGVLHFQDDATLDAFLAQGERAVR